MLPKLPLDEIGKSVPSSIDLFVCAASFEGRCLSIASRLANRVSQAVIIRAKEFYSSTEENYVALRAMFSRGISDAVTSSMSPTVTADVFAKEVIARIKNIRTGNVFVDVTTFTHEQILILIALMKHSAIACKV